MGPCVIVGAGVAGAEAAVALRRNGFTDRIILVGEECHRPYQRPPLSKAYLSGAVALESLSAKPDSAYQSASVELMTGTRVEQIDRASRQVLLSDGTSLPYGALVLAQGGRARPLGAFVRGIPGSIRNLHTIRTIDDVDRLKPQLSPGKRMVIIGGGYIGLEIAAVAVKLGLSVCVLERLSRVLARVTAPEVSAFYERVHREAGVELRTGVEITGLRISGDAIDAICTGGGDEIEADIVIAGIGMIPNVELGRDAGLVVSDGIVVGHDARTSEPDIYAIGDCSCRPCAGHADPMRLESVPNALEQARVAAAAICGRPAAAQGIPWFWSDQYDLKLQIVGISKGYEGVVIRGSMDERRFSVLYLRDDRVIAADAINSPQDFAAARALISGRAAITPSRLADRSIPLGAVA